MCAARGILKGDNTWDQCLEEAGLIQTDQQLRQLFISILIHNDPQDPLALYQCYLSCLSDYCQYKLQKQFNNTDSNYEQIKSLALREIEIILNVLTNLFVTIICQHYLSI